MVVTAYPIVISFLLIASGMTLLIGLQAALMGVYRFRTEIFRQFSILSFSISGYLVSTAMLYISRDFSNAALALKIQSAMLCIMPVPFFIFIALYTGQKQIKPWAVGIAIGAAILFFANLFSEYSIRFNNLYRLDDLVMPWEESLRQFSGNMGAMFIILLLITITLLLWALYRGVELYLKERSSRGLLLMVSSLLLIASAIWGILIDTGVVNSFYMVGFAHLSLVFLVSVNLAHELKENAKDIERKKTFKAASFATEHYLGNLMNMFQLVELEHEDDGRVSAETIKLMRQEIRKTENAVKALCNLEEPTPNNIRDHVQRNLT